MYLQILRTAIKKRIATTTENYYFKLGTEFFNCADFLVYLLAWFYRFSVACFKPIYYYQLVCLPNLRLVKYIWLMAFFIVVARDGQPICHGIWRKQKSDVAVRY